MLVAASTAFGQVATKRLSDWLLEQPYSAEAYPLGLSWRVPEERASQALLRRDLLASLTGLEREVTAEPASVARMREWLESLPVTGRVPVPLADARWLQANVARDPIIEPHHTIVLPNRPRTVTVINENGDLCRVTHHYGSEALAYVKACNAQAAVDWAWIAQPDGRVQRFGIATWNRQTQDELAPGAWIWAPSRGTGWPEIFSERLIRFLATQGPAEDPAAASVPGTPAAAPVAPSRSTGVTASDWGTVGLLQMPSARFAKAGTFNFTFSHVQPYSRIHFFVQPLDWLEAGFRYSDIANRPYDPTGTLNTNQSLKDKGFDAKFKLWDESAWLPQVAVGFRDLAGTGLFSGEFVVASKRTDAFDWTLGLGWGYVGGRGNMRNPLSALFGSRFDSRKPLSSEGGTPLFGSYFHGPTSLFGGVQYQTPWEPLFLKLEYDGNNYQNEPLGNNQVQKSPWNLGLVYRGRWVDLSLGWERGNKLMVGLTLFVDLPEAGMPKLSDPPRVPTIVGRGAGTSNWATTGEEINRQSGWYVERLELRGRELHVTLDDAGGQHWRERLDRVAAVLNRDAPPSVDRFVLLYRQRGIDIAEHVIDRDAWVAERSRFLPPGEHREWVVARPAQTGPAHIPPFVGVEPSAPDARRSGAIKTLYERPQQRFDWNVGVDFQQTIGGPDAFALFSLHGAFRSSLRITDDTWARAIFRLRLLDNYDKFTFTGPSNLPRVRTFLREYLTTSQFTMPVLQVTHASQLTRNQYYSIYAGYFEEMFGGAGAEWLYRPFASRLAFGAEVNALKQRDFHQNFGFRDYNVVSGHATAYWDTGWNDVQVKLIAGRYLAKDIGATLDFSRVFKNGITVGAFATKTNVSAAEFGEGSFDKGVYISVPFDVMLTRSSTSTANLLWRPLTRDGGAILGRIDRLYGLTRLRDEKTLWYAPAAPRNDSVKPEDRHESWTPRPEAPQPWTRVETRPTVKQWEDSARSEHALIQALYQQRFRNIQVVFDSSYRLNITAANESLRPSSRAVGRAVRTAIRFAPLETREIRVTFAERADPVVVYEFADITRLQSFLAGQLSRESFADTVAVRYFDPSARETDPLARFGDLDTLDDTTKIANALPDGRTLKRIGADVEASAEVAAGANWWRFTALSIGALAAGAALDKRAFNYASDHADSSVLKGLSNVANALPWVALGGAALAAIDGSDPRRSQTGFAAAEAGVTAGFAATMLKYAIGRARPEAGLGNASFSPGSTASDHGSFPSNHVAVAWGVVTPFAKEYDADWLYGVAALSNLGRIASRAHWVSDTVGGSLLGYAVGRLFWEASRKPQSQGAPRVLLNPSGVSLAWDLE